MMHCDVRTIENLSHIGGYFFKTLAANVSNRSRPLAWMQFNTLVSCAVQTVLTKFRTLFPSAKPFLMHLVEENIGIYMLLY